MYRRFLSVFMAVLMFSFVIVPPKDVNANPLIIGGVVVGEEILVAVAAYLGVSVAVLSIDWGDFASSVGSSLDSLSVVADEAGQWLVGSKSALQGFFEGVKGYISERFTFNSETDSLSPVGAIDYVNVKGGAIDYVNANGVSLPCARSGSISDGFSFGNYVYRTKSTVRDGLCYMENGFYAPDGSVMKSTGGIVRDSIYFSDYFLVLDGKNNDKPVSFRCYVTDYSSTTITFCFEHCFWWASSSSDGYSAYTSNYVTYIFKNGSVNEEKAPSVGLASSNAFVDAGYIDNVFAGADDYVDDEGQVAIAIPADIPAVLPDIVWAPASDVVDAPDVFPTEEPTAFPPVIPTDIPTVTDVPDVIEPTEIVTDVPDVVEPTDIVTEVPDIVEPTTIPTTIPTAIPTAIPTSIPVDIPDVDVPPVTDLGGIFDFLSEFFANLLETLKNALQWFASVLVGTGTINLDAFKLNSVALSETFPLSIPFDLLNCFKLLVAEPRAPVFVYDFTDSFSSLGTPVVLSVDMGDGLFAPVYKVFRWFEFASFVVGLILVTRSLVRG